MTANIDTLKAITVIAEQISLIGENLQDFTLHANDKNDKLLCCIIAELITEFSTFQKAVDDCEHAKEADFLEKFCDTISDTYDNLFIAIHDTAKEENKDFFYAYAGPQLQLTFSTHTK